MGSTFVLSKQARVLPPSSNSSCAPSSPPSPVTIWFSETYHLEMLMCILKVWSVSLVNTGPTTKVLLGLINAFDGGMHLQPISTCQINPNYMKSLCNHYIWISIANLFFGTISKRADSLPYNVKPLVCSLSFPTDRWELTLDWLSSFPRNTTSTRSTWRSSENHVVPIQFLSLISRNHSKR